MKDEKRLVLIIRAITIFFMLSLILSGITAFALESEIKFLCKILDIPLLAPPEAYNGLKSWIVVVKEALIYNNNHYPFMAYGTDWLAFAHIIIAIAFIGFYREPVRNKWIIYFGMIACAGIIPLAFICGPIRSIPFYWQLIDCSFGLLGFIPLYYLHRLVRQLEAMALNKE
ncbi:MAG: hypothetical protein LBD21_08705 [Tannerellaceae bacterium]|jgi:hypothetical protein|nr:hypothetical protein [Tannerellaceae bacterium]